MDPIAPLLLRLCTRLACAGCCSSWQPSSPHRLRSRRLQVPEDELAT